jgi:hypothetical protein
MNLPQRLLGAFFGVMTVPVIFVILSAVVLLHIPTIWMIGWSAVFGAIAGFLVPHLFTYLAELMSYFIP